MSKNFYFYFLKNKFRLYTKHVLIYESYMTLIGDYNTLDMLIDFIRNMKQ
jgi:hypothetical protein